MKNTTQRPATKQALFDVMNFTVRKLGELKNTAQVLGETIEVGEMRIIPVAKVSVGAAGGTGYDTDAGVGMTRTPQAFLVIRGDDVQVLRIPQNELVGDWLPMVIEKAKALMTKE